MLKIDETKLKTVVATLFDRDASSKLEPDNLTRLLHRTASRRASMELFKNFFERLGLKPAELDRLLQNHRAEMKAFVQKQEAEAKSVVAANHHALNDALQSLSDLAAVMADSPADSLVTFVTLDKPFLIWQFPHPQLDIWIDSHIESLKNYITVYVDKKSGYDTTFFKFHFLWTNESETWSLVNVGTSLIFNGFCIINADHGIVDGDDVNLFLKAELKLMRWHGWPPDVDGKPADGTYQPYQQLSQHQIVWNKDVYGLGYFGGGQPGYDYQRQVFTATPFGLSYQYFPVPPGGVAIFEVSLQLSYGIDGGNDDSYVLANFYDRIFCPSVILEVINTTGTMEPWLQRVGRNPR
jgi:hypothetical protein